MISTLLSVSLLSSLALGGGPDDVLLIERMGDARGRARAAQQFAKVRVDLHAEKMSMKDFARFCAAAAGDRFNFIISSKGVALDDLPTVSLTLRKASLLQIMGVVQSTTDIRFVYKAGVVLLKPKDELREAKYLRVYDIRAAVAPLRDHPGPKLGLVPQGSDALDAELPEDGDKTLSGWNIDQVTDLVRNHVAPESWDEAGATISSNRGALWVRQSPRNQKKVRALLLKIGVIQPVRTIVRSRRVPARKVTIKRPAVKKIGTKPARKKK